APTQIVVDGQPPSITNLVIDNTTLNTDENNDTFDDYVKNTDNVTISATITDNSPISAAGFYANLSGFYGGSGHTADPPNSYSANVATWIINGINCSPANGTISVMINAADTVGNVSTDSKTIIADNIPPTKILNFSATPGHKKVTLQWSDPTGNDAHYKGAIIRFNRWNDYPTFGVASPPYPATPTSGTQAFSAAAGTNAVHTFTTPDRDVYYYTAFAVDWAGNASPADAASQDRSTNYYLGDLGSGTGTQIPGDGYDGRVNFDDLIWFSNQYLNGGIWPYPASHEADFAPTIANKTYAAGSSLAIPAPDGNVDFEDLIVFSFNYLTVVPKIARPPDAQIASQLALTLVQSNITTSSNAGEVQVRVHLANNGSKVKGCSATIRFNPSRVRYLGVSNGDVFGAQGQGLYFIKPQEGKLQVDAAVLGTDRTIDFSGDVAVLRFSVWQGGEESIVLDQALIRDGNNGNLQVALNQASEKLPSAFRLHQNYPNPFNPSTTIKYEIPIAADVSIEVVNILGEVVATLSAGRQETGYHKVVWDGVDRRGTNAATGVYLLRMKAGNFTAVQKMLLIR
ncbi:MAG: FlgD immunoglobulin-like domain containing protein, partial [bacterium]